MAQTLLGKLLFTGREKDIFGRIGTAQVGCQRARPIDHASRGILWLVAFSVFAVASLTLDTAMPDTKPTTDNLTALGISLTEYQTTLARCLALPPAQHDYRINDYVENLLLTVVDFQLQTVAVERAMQHYREQAQRSVYDYDTLRIFLATFPDTDEGNETAAQFLWGYRLWTRVALLRGLFGYFAAQNITTQEELREWAFRTPFADFKGKVPGLGYAIFNWLILRQGVETIKPDTWVHRFAKNATGRTMSDTAVVALLMQVARAMAIPAYELDWRIWEQRGNTAGPDQAGASHPEGEEMTIADVNTLIGIGASTLGIVAGTLTVRSLLKKPSTAAPVGGAPVKLPKSKIAPAAPAASPAPPPVSIAGVTVFENDDTAYLQWVAAHPSGLVLNTYKAPQNRPVGMVLHKATCGSVRSSKVAAGGYTGRDFIKICSNDRAALANYAKANGRPDGTFSGLCGLCRP